MNIHHKIMIFLSAVLFVSVGAWAKREWKGATPYKRWWIVGLTVCIAGIGIVGLLRAFGV